MHLLWGWDPSPSSCHSLAFLFSASFILKYSNLSRKSERSSLPPTLAKLSATIGDPLTFPESPRNVWTWSWAEKDMSLWPEVQGMVSHSPGMPPWAIFWGKEPCWGDYNKWSLSPVLYGSNPRMIPPGNYPSRSTLAKTNLSMSMYQKVVVEFGFGFVWCAVFFFLPFISLFFTSPLKAE